MADRFTGRGFPGKHHANVITGFSHSLPGRGDFLGRSAEHAQPKDPKYDCCYGRGFVMALNPRNGEIFWKYGTSDRLPEDSILRS